MMGNPGVERMEMPDNRNDQVRAHSLGRRIRRRKIQKTTGGVLPKNRGFQNCPKLHQKKKCLTGGL
jgi:hypothetical protein